MRANTLITVILIFLIAVFAGLAVRVFYLQNYKSKEYQANSQRQQYAAIMNNPPRGIIVDRNNNILAASNVVETVFAEPRVMTDPDIAKTVAGKLQNILKMPAHEILKKIYNSKNPGFVRIMEDINQIQRQAVIRERIFGIGIHSDWQRYFPMSNLTSHVVGYTGYELAGLEGIELQYNSILTGSRGKDVFVIDAHRKPLGVQKSSEEARPGSSLVLTIDSTIQEFTRNALIRQRKAFQAESAIAIVMDPWTGAILSMVSVPDFDPSDRNSTTPDTRRNRVVTDPFEPGSIFKPLVVALALDAGIISYNEKFYCEMGSYSGKGFGTIGEWAGHRFGNLNAREILVRSSNIGMAKIGRKMGKKRLYDAVKLFGFGCRTGIDLPGEAPGTVRKLSKWDGYSVTRVPYGHEITVTPLQIIRAYAILANGGSSVTPHLVSAVVNADGQIEKIKTPAGNTGYVIDTEVANWIVQDALVGVVRDDAGTGHQAALKKWQVFGKTGTANISKKGGGYDEQNYVASFAGGAPADDPAVVILVAVRKPDKSLNKGYSGGKVAAPAAREILENTLTYLERI